MKRSAAHAASAGPSHDDRYTGAVAVAARCGEVREHVEAAGDEVDELNLGDRTHAHVRSTDRRADDRGLGDRRVDHAGFAEALLEAFGHLERAAIDTDVLAEDKDPLIARHLLEERLPDRLEIGDDGHFTPSKKGTSPARFLALRNRLRRTRRA
jgi:hypothetical protein